jgi:hypothetical protein
MAENDDRIVYRYSRAERLKHAPRIVQEMEERKKGGKKGFFYYVRHNRGMMYMLATIFAFAVFAGLLGIAQGKGGSSIKDYAISAKAEVTGKGVSISIELKEKGLRALLGLSGGGDARVVSVAASTDGTHYERGDYALSDGASSTVYFSLPSPGAKKVWLLIGMGGSSVDIAIPVSDGSKK